MGDRTHLGWKQYSIRELIRAAAFVSNNKRNGETYQSTESLREQREIRQTSGKPVVLLLLETFDGERPRGCLTLIFLGELMDIRTVPVPPLPMGGGGRTSRSISRPFRGSVLAILLSAQSAKSRLLFIVTCTWR